MADRTWMSFTWKLGTTHKGKNLGMIKHEAPGRKRGSGPGNRTRAHAWNPGRVFD